MDKSKIAVIVIAVVMVILVGYVLVISGNDSGMTRDQYLEIGENIYTVKDVKNHILITNESAGDIAKELSFEEKEEAINAFLSTKLYANAAVEKGIQVPEEEVTKFKSEYAEKALLNANGISEEEYIAYATDSYRADQLVQNLKEYYELPESQYDAVVESIEEPMKSYSFRIMNFYYDEEVAADVSGETSGETSGEVVSETSRESVLATATEVRQKVISGEDFSTLAKEHSSYRYTFKGSMYTLVNGDVEYATSVLLQDKLGNETLYNAAKDLQSGECTELIEDEEQNMIYLLKMETVEDGFTGEADKEMREILLYQMQDALILEDLHYHVNDTALIDLLY